jgi:hypothetical protein
VLLYRIGDRAMGPMVNPFVDRFSDEEIATRALARSRRRGRGAGFVARQSPPARIGCRAGPNSLRCGGRDGAGWGCRLVPSPSGWPRERRLPPYWAHHEKEHAAVQYALVTSLYAFAGTLVAAASGWLTERTGYTAYFALTAAFALPAFAFLRGAQGWIGLADAAPPALTPASSPEPQRDPPRP